MDNEKELFEEFVHNNMPEEPFDPDKILAEAQKQAYEPSEHFKKEMEKLLRQSKRQARKNSVKNFFTRRGIPQIAVSLCVILCAVVVVQANNGARFDLLFQPHQNYTGVQLTEQVRQGLFSDNLEELGKVEMPVYFPRYLPKGYAIADIEGSQNKVEITLTNESNNYILIVQKSLDGYDSQIDLDSENTELEKVTIATYQGFYKMKDSVHTLYFFDNNNYYKVLGDALTKKELIRIAESFEMVA